MEFIEHIENLDKCAKDYGCDSELCYKLLDLATRIHISYPYENNLRTFIDEWRLILRDIPDDAIGFAMIRDECNRVIKNAITTLVYINDH